MQAAATAATPTAVPVSDPRFTKCGFAKLLGDNNFEYYIKKYEVVLGRRSKAQVDVVLGDSPVLSRHHAKILYNFAEKRWELHVEGKNGVTVNGQLYTPMSPPCVLQSQDLLQAGDYNFYFLLPKVTRKRGPNKPKAATPATSDVQQQQQSMPLQQPGSTPQWQQPQPPAPQPATAVAAAAPAQQQQQQQSPALPGVNQAAAAAGLRSYSGPLLPGMSPGSNISNMLQGGGSVVGNSSGDVLQMQPGGLGLGNSGGLGFGNSLPTLPSNVLYGSDVLAPGASGGLEELAADDQMKS